MDAASLFMLGTEFFPAQASGTAQLEVRRLFKSSFSHKKQLPVTLFLPAGPLQAILAPEAERQGISVVPVPESQLHVFVGEAKQGFREHLSR
jgi:hypothetical protein